MSLKVTRSVWVCVCVCGLWLCATPLLTKFWSLKLKPHSDIHTIHVLMLSLCSYFINAVYFIFSYISTKQLLVGCVLTQIWLIIDMILVNTLLETHCELWDTLQHHYCPQNWDIIISPQYFVSIWYNEAHEQSFPNMYNTLGLIHEIFLEGNNNLLWLFFLVTICLLSLWQEFGRSLKFRNLF